MSESQEMYVEGIERFDSDIWTDRIDTISQQGTELMDLSRLAALTQQSWSPFTSASIIWCVDVFTDFCSFSGVYKNLMSTSNHKHWTDWSPLCVDPSV